MNITDHQIQKRAIVVGAGIAGLASAYRLQKLGYRVEVFEATGRAGGRGQLLNRPNSDDWADVGTQFFHTNYEYTKALIKDLGLEGEIRNIAGKTRFFSADGSSYLVNPDIPWISAGGISGNLSLFWYMFKFVITRKMSTYGLQDQDELDDLPALDSTKNQFAKDYLIRMLSLTGGLSEPDFANVSTLQIARLIRIILLTKFFTLKGGTASLHAALAEHLNINYNAPAKKILLDDDGNVCGIELKDGRSINADEVVIATEGPTAATLLPNQWSKEQVYLSSIKMPPTIIVSFFLNRSLEQDVWTYYLPVEEQQTVCFCVDPQQKNPAKTPSGKATLQAWIVNPHAEALMDESDEVITEKAKADVEKFMPGFSSMIEDSSITKHAMAVPQYSIGQNQRSKAFLNAINSRSGVHFCGDYLSGGYLECALWSVDIMIEKLKAKS